MISSTNATGRACAVGVAVILTASGCVLAPRDMDAERARVAVAGEAYESARAARVMTELAADADWRALLRHAFLANGDLEAAYLEWRAAVERVGIAAAYPNTNTFLTFSYLFSGGNASAWDRTTLNLGFDPMQNLSFPLKTVAAGRVAFAEAQAAGKRFAAAKFALQEQVLTAYAEFALLAERVRLQSRQLDLATLAAASAVSRATAGGAQQDVLAAQIARANASNELRAIEAELHQAAASLNALLGRDPAAPLAPPAALPAPRDLPAGDARLLAVATTNNPELAALAHEVVGRDDALTLAKLQYVPDVNPFAAVTGNAAQMAGAGISVPATLPRIWSAIAEARANLQRAEALATQTRLDRGARFVATLVALRDAERQAAFFTDRLLPLSAQLAMAAEARYTTGAAPLTDVIDAQRTAIDVELALAEARTAREQRLATLEALAGVDAETLADIPTAAPEVQAETTEVSRVD